MHDALHLPNILGSIAYELKQSDCARLLRVSRYFWEVAGPVLWGSHQIQFVHLWDILLRSPPDGDDLDEPLAGGTYDWERFALYASWVKSLCVNPFIRYAVKLDTILLPHSDRNFFPALRSLKLMERRRKPDFEQVYTTTFAALRLFLPQNLEDMDIDILPWFGWEKPGTTPLAKICDVLSVSQLRLRTFHIRTHVAVRSTAVPTFPHDSQPLCRWLSGQTTLRRVTLSAPPRVSEVDDAISTLASLPSLETLSLNLASAHTEYFWSIPDHAFPVLKRLEVQEERPCYIDNLLARTSSPELKEVVCSTSSSGRSRALEHKGVIQRSPPLTQVEIIDNYFKWEDIMPLCALGGHLTHLSIVWYTVTAKLSDAWLRDLAPSLPNLELFEYGYMNPCHSHRGTMPTVSGLQELNKYCTRLEVVIMSIAFSGNDVDAAVVHPSSSVKRIALFQSTADDPKKASEAICALWPNLEDGVTSWERLEIWDSKDQRDRLKAIWEETWSLVARKLPSFRIVRYPYSNQRWYHQRDWRKCQ